MIVENVSSMIFSNLGIIDTVIIPNPNTVSYVGGTITCNVVETDGKSIGCYSNYPGPVKVAVDGIEKWCTAIKGKLSCTASEPPRETAPASPSASPRRSRAR
jgi:hypothetical protein